MTILPPHNIDAERAIIGGILIDNDAMMDTGDLQPVDFFDGRLGALFAGCHGLHATGRPVDTVTLAAAVPDASEADIIGLMTTVPTSANTAHYAAIVKAHSQRRQVIRLAGQMTTAAYKADDAPETIIDDAQRGLIDIRNARTDDNLRGPNENASAFIEEMQAETRHVIPTGYIDLDRMLGGGLEPGNVYAFCAAEKMGKTALVSGMSLYNARAGRVVLRFSLEMSARQRTRRDVSLLTRIPIGNLKRRELTDDQWRQAYEAAGKISQMRLHIDETPAVTPSQMRASINRVLMLESRIDLIELDYFQLAEVDKPSRNRVVDLEEISRNLAIIARTYNVPVIVTAQVLSKSIEQRSDKRPYLSDVFGSSALAKDAFMIAFLYRDEYYNPETTERPNIGELIVRAHRDGPTGTIDLYFNGPCAMYANYRGERIEL